MTCSITQLTKPQAYPAKTQTSLADRVWTSSQSNWIFYLVLYGYWRTQKFFMPTVKTDQSALMLRLIWVFAGHMPFCRFLAHLSQRLTSWAYSIPMVRRRCRRRPHFQTWISLKPYGQSWSNFICSITGVGERLRKVLGQIGSKLRFLWQQKAPIGL